MNTIDLDSIIDKQVVSPERNSFNATRSDLYNLMIKAIHEVLELASQNAKIITSENMHPKGWPYGMVNQKPNPHKEEQYFIVEKQSILDIEKLIVWKH